MQDLPKVVCQHLLGSGRVARHRVSCARDRATHLLGGGGGLEHAPRKLFINRVIW